MTRNQERQKTHGCLVPRFVVYTIKSCSLPRWFTGTRRGCCTTQPAYTTLASFDLAVLVLASGGDRQAGWSSAGSDGGRGGPPRHAMAVVPCRIVSPCPGRGPGTALPAISRVVPCRAAGHTGRRAPLLSQTSPQLCTAAANASPPPCAAARTCSSYVDVPALLPVGTWHRL